MEGTSAIRLVDDLPYEVLYSILRHLSAKDIEELQYVNRRMHMVVSGLNAHQRLIWFPFRMIPCLPIGRARDTEIRVSDRRRRREYNRQQTITRHAIAYQSERDTVRQLALEAFKRGILRVVRYHLINDNQYFPEAEGIDSDPFSLMKELVNAAPGDNRWHEAEDNDELSVLYQRASSGAYEVFEWAKHAQLLYRNCIVDACKYLSSKPIPAELSENAAMTREEYRVTVYKTMLQDLADVLTPRMLLDLAEGVHSSNTAIMEIISQMQRIHSPDYTLTLDERASVRKITLGAFATGDLSVVQHHIRRRPDYFPLPTVATLSQMYSSDIFEWIVCIERLSPRDWVWLEGADGDYIMFYATEWRMYELFEWMVHTQPGINIDRYMLEKLGSDPENVDIPTEDIIAYRRSLFSYLLRTNTDKLFEEELCLLLLCPRILDVQILKTLFLVTIKDRIEHGSIWHAPLRRFYASLPQTISKLLSAGPDLLQWVYYHYNYTIPGNTSNSSDFIRHVIALGFTLDTVLTLIRLDRTLLKPMAEVMSSIAYGEFVPMEFGIICILNGIDIEHIARRMVNGSSRQASDTYILHVLMALKCYENLSYSAHYMDMIHDIRKDGYHQLLATLQGGYGPATDAGSLCRAGAILDNVTWVSDVLPRVPALGQEVCNLALQMASVNVLDYLQKDYDLVPDDDAILWTCRYGMADALRSVSARVTQIYHLATAIEMGNVETALYLRDELHVPMPTPPNITTLSMKRALRATPDMMQLCREGNLALLQALTPDPFYFLSAVEVGNGRVLEWFIDNAENLPITEACHIARRNEMWYLYDWLADKDPDMPLLSRLHKQWRLLVT